jgi:hypothetical protein
LGSRGQLKGATLLAKRSGTHTFLVALGSKGMRGSGQLDYMIGCVDGETLLHDLVRGLRDLVT